MEYSFILQAQTFHIKYDNTEVLGLQEAIADYTR